MPALLLLTLKHHGPHRPRIRLRHHRELLGEMAQPEFDRRNIHFRPIPSEFAILGGFIIDAQGSRGARSAVPVDGDPGQDLVVGPGVTVRPIVEFLVHPCQQADGGVGERVAQCLRFGGLLQSVTASFLQEPVRPNRAVPFAGVGGRELVLEVEEGV